MVIYCDRNMDVRCASSTIALKDISEKTGRILDKLGRNDSYIVLFKNCSNGFGPSHI